MVGFNIYIVLFIFIYLYGELFMSIIFSSIFRNLKFFSIQLLKDYKFVFFKKIFFIVALNSLIFYILTLKLNINNIMYSFIIVYILLTRYIRFYFDKYLNFLSFNTVMFIFILFFINNFITFYLFIELYVVIFYFFFLNIKLDFKQLYLIQYKNSLLLYLFNNFLTSILYLFGVSSVIYIYGTLNFYELNFFNHLTIDWKCYTLILSFFIKMSLPGYHFLKIEIYKYLSLNNVILFSVISLYINYLLMMYFFNQNIIFNILNLYKLHTLLLLSIFFFFIHKLKLSNFQEFISYSGFATNNLIILNYLL